MSDDPAPPPKSAEDRKAASALANLDESSTNTPTSDAKTNIDQDAVNKAMKNLSNGAASSKPAASKPAAAAKAVKVDAADVALLVTELEITKAKATEMLKSHGGDLRETLRAYIRPDWVQ